MEVEEHGECTLQLQLRPPTNDNGIIVSWKIGLSPYISATYLIFYE